MGQFLQLWIQTKVRIEADLSCVALKNQPTKFRFTLAYGNNNPKKNSFNFT